MDECSLAPPFMLWILGLALPLVHVMFHVSILHKVFEDLDLLEIVAEVMTLMLIPEYVASLYLRFTVNIWWTMRFETLQELMNVASSMAQRAAIYFPGQDEVSVEAKETIMRYGVLSVALFWKDAREIDGWTMQVCVTNGAASVRYLQASSARPL